jgi:LPS-assembly protein
MMRRRGRAAIAVVTLSSAALLPALAASQQPDEGAAPPDSALGLKLKTQVELLPPVAPDTGEDIPIFLEADRLEGYPGREVRAQGSVVIRRRGLTLWADSVSYNQAENAVTASGNVRLNRLGDVITGDQAYYQLDKDAGHIDHPTYRLRQLGARGTANRIVMKDRDRVRAERATYTNCAVGNDDWFMRVNRLDLDRVEDVGVARNATLRFKGVPVLYTPWMDFPLSTRRKSGFLPPLIGSTAQSGFEFSVPYYWNIKPNLDFTFTPRVLARRGLMLGNEFRYLDPNYRGEVRFEYLPNDRVKGEDRYGYNIWHRHNITRRLSAAVNVLGVSDDTYFRDLSARIQATSQTNLPREVSAYYNGDWWNLRARAQKFQTLQDPLAPVTPPYERLPQINLNAARSNLSGLGVDGSFFGELVNFQHPTLISSRRQVYYPWVSYPFRTPLFYVTPKLGYNYTYYSYPDQSRPDDSRSLPIFSVDSGMTFERNTTMFKQAWLQTLEPRLYYVFIPFRDQNNLPVFDTSVADFNFAQIFTENRFTGWDRINDANELTAAVSSRLIDPQSGVERIRVLLGQRYYLQEQRVTLPGAPLLSGRSDLLAAIRGRITDAWSTDAGMQYTASEGDVQRFNVLLRYQPEAGRVVNLGYRYTRGLLETVDLSSQWPLTKRLGGLARFNYSLADRQLIQGLVGLEYNAGCWTARFVAQRFVVAANQFTSAVFVQFELGGLSRLGSNPLAILRQNIGGYERAPARAPAPGEYYPGMDEP